MTKIGLTLSGSVIVEMSSEEFAALEQFQIARRKAATETKADLTKMTAAEKVEYVRTRLAKLTPKKRDGVIHSIEAMFQFNGGIKDQEIQKIISNLQKAGFFSITSDDKVTYR